MSDWEDYYTDKPYDGPFGFLKDILALMFRDMAGETHGGEKAAAGAIPIYGSYRSVRDEINKADDYYENTGTDPWYPSDVSRLNSSAISQMTSGLPSLPRMARTMTQLYPAEILENVAVRMARPMLSGPQKLLGRMDDVIDMEEY